MAAPRPVELAISVGDPQGVGPEVAVAAARVVAAEDAAVRCVLVGPAEVLAKAGADAAWPRLAPDEPATRPLSTIAVAADPCVAPPPSAEGGRAALASVVVAADRVLARPDRALVTAPLGKDAVRRAGVADFAGHTEFLAARCGVAHPVMLFSAPTFRAALVTVHAPLRRVPELITTERLVRMLRIVAWELERRFGIAAPRLDVLGLNPHAGEGGAFGDEEATKIVPAIEALRREGVRVAGPFAADSYFLEGFGGRADCVVAMYHDQGLVAVKALAFKEAVNVTLGLPMVRTSPDHGTAYALAGAGRSDAAPMQAALREAVRLVRTTAPGRERDVPPAAL